jgi:hypothetical protein
VQLCVLVLEEINQSINQSTKPGPTQRGALPEHVFPGEVPPGKVLAFFGKKIEKVGPQ